MINKTSQKNDLTSKQTTLSGSIVDQNAEEVETREDVQVLKSILQKAVRRGMVEKAMYAAYQLSNKKTGWILWRRLVIISVEDALDTAVVTAIDILRREAREFGYDSEDGKRCAVAAGLLLAESKKDRRADEFLELMDASKKHRNEVPELKGWMDELERTPDEALDMHTTKGRRMGRGLNHWYEVSSETVNKTNNYMKWREWWKPLILKTIKESKNDSNLQPEGSSNNLGRDD